MNEIDIKNFGEFNLIDRIQKNIGVGKSVVQGIGDDAAVVRLERKDKLLLYTCDTIVENVHFTKNTAPYRIGWKALAVNLSDIAAMGGGPKYALISLGCPKRTPIRKIDGIYRGIRALAKEFDVNIIGGDTIHLPKALVITITVIGEVERKFLTLRRGAKVGDAICVTGTLGGSFSCKKHLFFTPRINEARFLTQNFQISSMIDVSDGLAGDLMRILEQNKVGAKIFADKIPISKAAISSSKGKKKTALKMALYDGEDFELLFTVNKKETGNIQKRFEKKFSILLSIIGEITKPPQKIILIKENGKEKEIPPEGYNQFR